MLARLETRYVSVLMRQPNGTYKYESRRKETTLDESSRWRLPPAGYALHARHRCAGQLRVRGARRAGQQLARFDYQVAGEGNVTRALEKNAELELALSKRDYAPGEEIEVSIRAPYEGAGLITIERERVYAWHWFKTTTTSSVQQIKLPEGLEGNAYVTVTFVRDPGSSEIYTSPLSYGVQPFSIDVDARRNHGHGRSARAGEARRDDDVPLSHRAAVAPGAVRGRRRHPAGRELPDARSARPLLPEARARSVDDADPRSDPAGVPAAGSRRPRRAAMPKACSASISIRSVARARSRSRTGRASSMRTRRRAS